MITCRFLGRLTSHAGIFYHKIPPDVEQCSYNIIYILSAAKNVLTLQYFLYFYRLF